VLVKRPPPWKEMAMACGGSDRAGCWLTARPRRTNQSALLPRENRTPPSFFCRSPVPRPRARGRARCQSRHSPLERHSLGQRSPDRLRSDSRIPEGWRPRTAVGINVPSPAVLVRDDSWSALQSNCPDAPPPSGSQGPPGPTLSKEQSNALPLRRSMIGKASAKQSAARCHRKG
jgi:hypothetical protein